MMSEVVGALRTIQSILPLMDGDGGPKMKWIMSVPVAPKLCRRQQKEEMCVVRKQGCRCACARGASCLQQHRGRCPWIPYTWGPWSEHHMSGTSHRPRLLLRPHSPAWPRKTYGCRCFWTYVSFSPDHMLVVPVTKYPHRLLAIIPQETFWGIFPSLWLNQ